MYIKYQSSTKLLEHQQPQISIESQEVKHNKLSNLSQVQLRIILAKSRNRSLPSKVLRSRANLSSKE